MGMWTAIALISIAAIFGEAYRRRHEGGGKETAEQLEQLNEKVDRIDSDLRERVETLERIVTDRSEELKRKFEHLDKAS